MSLKTKSVRLAQIGLLLLPTASMAQGVSSTQVVTPQAAGNYWTPQRLQNAKPIELQVKVGPNGLPLSSSQPAPAAGQSERGEGGPPSVKAPPAVQLFTPAAPKSGDALPLTGVAPSATSSYGARYTTSRERAPGKYPATTVGKLYFHDNGNGKDYVCSASVLRPRIVMTAGHCIAHPSTNANQRYFYTNHYFIPQFNQGTAPAGTWYPSQLWVTNAWYMSDGSVPNAADEGIMVAADRSINGAPTKIGSVTGYLGWITYALSNNNITMKGYPCNLDSCQRMETSNAQTYAYGGNNTYIYGSAMRGGASGGPWVQDYGYAPVSDPPVSLGNNYIAAVTSYGPIATEPAYLGASVFDGTFTNLLNAACGAAAGNC